MYYFYRKLCKNDVFRSTFETYLEIQKNKLDTEKLNLEGTHSLVKKAAQSCEYQFRKKERTPNVLITTDDKVIPISIGSILKGNHNDLYQIFRNFLK